MKVNNVITLKFACWLLALSPLVWLIYMLYTDQLSADPIKDIQHFTGKTAIRFVLLTLLLSPLGRFRFLKLLNRVKRIIGLSAFFWATLHIFTYLSLELAFDFSLFLEEITSRNYLIIGLISWLGLLSLAITSPQFAMRILKQNWKRLHSCIYIFALLAATHYLISLKLVTIYPIAYLVLFMSLWAFHFYRRFK